MDQQSLHDQNSPETNNSQENNLTENEILFPHETMRQGQDQLISDINYALSNKKIILAHAPTGLGKTASALSIAIPLAKKLKKKVFFLTNRHTQHKIAVDTLKEIRKKFQINVFCSDLISKKAMCTQEVASLFGSDFNEFCKSLVEKNQCSYYSRVKSKKGTLTVESNYLLDKLKQRGPLHNDELQTQCKLDSMCSYEIAIEMAKKADLIIGDYYYLFNPSVSSALLKKLNLDLSDIILILDEAHNVPNRVSDMLSSSLTTNVLRNAATEASKFGDEKTYLSLIKLNELMSKLASFKDSNPYSKNNFSKNPYSKNSYSKFKKNSNQSSLSLSSFKPASNSYSKSYSSNPSYSSSSYSQTSKFSNNECKISKDQFVREIKMLADYDTLMESCAKLSEDILKTQKKSFCKSVSTFLENWRGEDFAYSRILKQVEGKIGKYLELEYSCLDPSIASKEVFDNIHSAVVMSGTLTPLKMYADLLGVPKAIQKKYPSPFPIENKRTIIWPETSTKYSLRSESMYSKIAHICSSTMKLVPGNIALFFPSYRLRDKIVDKILTNKKVFIEKQNLSKEEKDSFIANFKSCKDQANGGALFAVTGANFAEGVDFPGKLLNAVIVIGIPLARPDLKTKQTIEYYDKKFGKGWDYAYTFPAMNKCIQSAGRCIRSGTDRGVIIYLDERFSWQKYYSCLPRQGLMVSKNAPAIVSKFFN